MHVALTQLLLPEKSGVCASLRLDGSDSKGGGSLDLLAQWSWNGSELGVSGALIGERAPPYSYR